MGDRNRSDNPKPLQLECTGCSNTKAIRYDQTHKFNYICPECGEKMESDFHKTPGSY